MNNVKSPWIVEILYAGWFQFTKESKKFGIVMELMESSLEKLL